jgi:hypothetical protein
VHQPQNQGTEFIPRDYSPGRLYSGKLKTVVVIIKVVPTVAIFAGRSVVDIAQGVAIIFDLLADFVHLSKDVPDTVGDFMKLTF